jgi:hypothetical protein
MRSVRTPFFLKTTKYADLQKLTRIIGISGSNALSPVLLSRHSNGPGWSSVQELLE